MKKSLPIFLLILGAVTVLSGVLIFVQMHQHYAKTIMLAGMIVEFIALVLFVKDMKRVAKS